MSLLGVACLWAVCKKNPNKANLGDLTTFSSGSVFSPVFSYNPLLCLKGMTARLACLAGVLSLSVLMDFALQLAGGLTSCHMII